MIRLDATTRKLEIGLAGAVTTTEPHVTVTFYDVPGETKSDYSEYRGGTKLTKTSGATPVTICDAPVQNGTVRNIDYICVHNADSVAATVTIRIDEATTDYNLVKTVLAVGETLIYEREGGWQIL